MTHPHAHAASPRDRVTGRALVVWAAAVTMYVVAFLGRTSLGVAGVPAMEHFHIDASRLAVFTSVQVGVYALAQIPTGVAIDRFGPRRMLIAGAVVMAVGQVVLGVTSSYPVAIAARVLVGAGDASAFLSVMRMLPAWFPLRRTPLFTQLTASMGQVGQFMSAVPFLALVESAGWRAAFVSLGVAGAVVAAVCGLIIRDAPPAAPGAGALQPAPPRMPLRLRLKVVLRAPVCWEGFFTHWLGLMPSLLFALLWGVPLMTLGQGLSTAQAGSVLVIGSVANIVAAPIHGMISARMGRSRWLVTLLLNGALMLGFVWFFSSPTPRGFAAVAVLGACAFATAPTSNFGFDSVRERLDHAVLAAGTGLANMGGFTAIMIAGQAVGWLLDARSVGRDYGWQDFRVAWWGVIVTWLVAALVLLVVRRRTAPRVRVVDATAPGAG